MRDREQQKKPNWLSWLVLILFLAPEAVLPVVLVGVVGYILFAALKEGNKSSASRKNTHTGQTKRMDDCPKQLFCFHKDKGEHHVARGREVDPWDRPDIDISKYQRKN